MDLKNGEENHGNYHFFEVDVTDKNRVQEVVSLIFNQEQKIDVLINNAGC
ncbi:sorbitol-6-phosphate 2-dehydrogenase [Staphylococcus gallinarum]|uniref:Sorbitol-6-phosphate 2-dehydrogenase n=1 Tax=Staphylococcus gallinarum TaxID=1293 RepID=A0A380FA71_STAGA|nr:sorbitol-6-phosphate 2-dehydrogenase [Staphylococcus gallinarum]